MNEKIKQAILESLRLGAKPEEIQAYLAELHHKLGFVVAFKPDHDIADFHRAYKDADFRP